MTSKEILSHQDALPVLMDNLSKLGENPASALQAIDSTVQIIQIKALWEIALQLAIANEPKLPDQLRADLTGLRNLMYAGQMTIHEYAERLDDILTRNTQ